LLGCLNDCDFSYLLSVPSVLNNYGSNCSDGTYNDTIFANNAIKYLPADIASTCIYTLCSLNQSAAVYTNPNASTLISDSSKMLKMFFFFNSFIKIYYFIYLAFINLVSPSTLDSFSQNETLALVNSLLSSNKTLTEAQIEALAGNLPDNYSEPIGNTVALASALPLTSFDSTSPRDLVTLIKNGKLQLSLLDDTRKIYIATTVFIDILKNAFLFKVYLFLTN
jgi:hypothetical protein